MAVPRAEIGVPDDAHLALCVGRLDPQKGLPDLLEAAERVITQCAQLVPRACWGWSKPFLAAGTNRQAAAVAKKEFTGWARVMISQAYSRQPTFLFMPSLWEGMPNVVLEAMAARRPVIGTAVEGTEDLVVPGQTGWLVPPHDPDALYLALIDAADSPERCERYGQQARTARRTGILTDARTVEAYEQLWAGILGLQLPD